MGVGSYGWLRYSKARWIGRAIYVLMNIPAISDLAAEETICYRVLYITKTGVFRGGSMVDGSLKR